MLVYKYVVADRIDVLEHSRIRFTQPAALNDPFEANPSFETFKDAVLDQIFSSETFESAVKNYDPTKLPILDEYKDRLRRASASDPAFYSQYLRDMLKLVLKVKIDEETQKHQEELMNQNFAILSISRRSDHPLMWSHYADSHRGFVIGFDTRVAAQ